MSERRLRIAVWHNLPSGGGKRALYDHVRGLIARGHHIESWCPPTADQTYLPLSELIEEHVVPLAYQRREVLDVALRLPRRESRSLAAMDAHCRTCAEQIAAGGFDILLAHPCMFFRASAIGRFTSIPKVLYQQEPFRWLYEAMPRLPWIAPAPSTRAALSPRRIHDYLVGLRKLANARFQARDELDNATAFDRILVNSLFSRESVIRAYGLDAEVCYLGTDTDRFVDQGLPRENVVVGLGAFTPEKNLGLAIEALALLPQPRPKLVWIGNVAYEGHIEKMMALAASRGVEFVPRVSIEDAELIGWLNRARVMVYAPRLEPFGFAPIEAGSCGLPVVAVAEGGVRETVIHSQTGLLVLHDPSAIAEAVGAILGDPQLAARLGSFARENAKSRWSLHAGTDRIEDALCRATAPSSR
jgi:glycosyltransferase involved in cell wall biosynthesis